ncbi:MAG: hypothetical protein K6E63_07435, partial [Lachnospiraceae bacterium]|nr:hypothetical protein [Lachnospiraceae bacterium]
MFKHSIKYFILLCLFVNFIMTAGCSKGEELSETTVSIDNKGVITHSIVESFDKDYYNEDELRSIIDAEVEEYGKEREKDCAKLESLEIKDGTATARMRFATYSDYAGFNDVDFFYGTVEEAIEKDYPTDVTLKSRNDNSTI